MSSKSKPIGASRKRSVNYYLNDFDYMLIIWKSKSISHANEKGRKDFLLGKSIEDCPYKEGIYKDKWESGYTLEQYGLPF